MPRSNAAEERTGPNKLGKHERTLLLRKLLYLSEEFLGCLGCFLFLVRNGNNSRVGYQERGCTLSQQLGFFSKGLN